MIAIVTALGGWIIVLIRHFIYRYSFVEVHSSVAGLRLRLDFKRYNLLKNAMWQLIHCNSRLYHLGLADQVAWLSRSILFFRV